VFSFFDVLIVDLIWVWKMLKGMKLETFHEA